MHEQNPVIAIPTKDRPYELRRLLTFLAELQRRYGHCVPVHVFDHSPNYTARPTVEELQGRSGLEITLFGEQERTALIDDVSERLSIPHPSVDEIFREGYGGNRNAILSQFPNSVVISIDDDIIPLSFSSHQDFSALQRRIDDGLDYMLYKIPLQSGLLAGNLRGFKKMVRYQEQGFHEWYDLIGTLLKHLGKRVTDLTLPTAKTLEFADDIYDCSTSSFDNKEDGLQYVITHDSLDKPTAQISAAFPLLSFHGDILTRHQHEDEMFTLDGLQPVVLPRIDEGYACFAADNTAYANVHFVPTRLPYEDIVHSYIMAASPEDAALMIGMDVMHKRNGSNYRDPHLTSTGVSLCGIIVRGILFKILENFSFNPERTSTFLQEIEKADEQQISFGWSNLKEFMEEARSSAASDYGIVVKANEIARIKVRAYEELHRSGRVFELWPRIIEYMRDKPK